MGDTYTFSPIITDDRATTSLTWQSSNTSVATINNGVMTTKGLGSTTITCIATNGVSAQCLVTVNPVLVNSLTLNKYDAELITGEELQLSVDVLPNNATNKSVTWSSTNEAVAVVSESGLVTAVGSGTCQVKATANDGSGKTASCLVTVKKAGNVYEDIHPKNSTATLTVTEAVMGDVNGDGRVSVTDVISMNSYILEEEPAQFIRKVADLNGDGKVTITDMVQVIDIILGR